MSMTPLVSVVVLNYNGAHLLADCLESLSTQDYANLEILVVDNASVDDSRDIVHRYASVRWVGLQVNGGLGPGYNAGAREAKGEKIFFVNNDMRFEPQCVRRLAEALKGDDVLATDPLQMDWEGQRIIHGAQRFNLGWRHVNFGVPFMAPYQNFEATEMTEVPWGCAGSIMFDRLKFELLGGFDETFFIYYEDLDICWRGWLRGWKTIFVPYACVYHKVGESHDVKLRKNNPAFMNKPFTETNRRYQLSICKNAQRFILKTMPWSMVLASMLVEAGKVVVGLIRGSPQLAWLRTKAVLLNIQEWREIFRERRIICEQSVTTSLTLLKHWGQSPGKGSSS